MEDEKLGRAGIVATQVLCGAAVVAGLKTVPALWNLHLITQPVQTLQIALVFCFFCLFFFLSCPCSRNSSTRRGFVLSPKMMMNVPIFFSISVFSCLSK
jgi:hypothetical protein